MTGLDHTIGVVAAGAAVLGATGGVLGSFAVLRRQSLMGDVLAHAALPGLCLGYLVAGRALPALMTGALVAGALAALSVLAIGRFTRLKSDAALGIVLSVWFAGGVVLLSHVQATGGAGAAGLSAFLFGQAAAMLLADVQVMALVGLLAVGAVAAGWPWIKLVCFDRDYARALGVPVAAVEAMLTLLMAMAIVVGLQMVGVVLMTAMLIAPAVAARAWVVRLWPMTVLAAVFGVLAGVGGAVISAGARGLATGPVVVLIATAIAAVSLALAPGRGAVWRVLRDRRLAAQLEGTRVLSTLAALGRAHGDPHYRAEAGMIDAAHGTATARTLDRLQAEGLVSEVSHPPETTRHWVLTRKGQAEAGAHDAPAPNDGGRA
ncbi:MAG: metal ABC transporter permease [Gemmobacter sp.]|uniref:metal ABC transporter permease n=1 Tax=Gemmobacter sp. TaxID=1898957 RepID=UPI00391C9E85